MGFKKHSWLSYGSQGDIIKIEICSSDGQKIDNFQTNNRKDYGRILKIIKDKYGFSPEIEIEHRVNYEKEKDWLS